MQTKILILASAVAVVAIAVAGYTELQGLRRQVRELQQQINVAPPDNTARPEPVEAPASSRRLLSQDRSGAGPDTTQWTARIAALEDAVRQLSKASDYLMERGQLPLGSNKLHELQLRFSDTAASDRDRLQALRLLRRNGGVTDDVAHQALAWLTGSTNNNLREDLLQQLEGMTNSVFRDPFVRLAMADPASDVREQAVENLRRFAADPDVEDLLWNILRTDTDGRVRQEAESALRRAPVTPERAETLRSRALDPQRPLDERITALQALRNGGQSAPDVTAALAQVAQASQDPTERARVYGAFDGSNDPNLKLPLVSGLQDPNPIVRERAADALSSFSSDPAIVEWLKYIAENDSDPRVRREAFQAMQSQSRR